MEIFAFNPKTDRETLESFNARMLDYSREAVVVGANPAKMGPGLTISVFTAEELEVPGGTPCVFPAVFHVQDTSDPELEEKLNEFVGEVLQLSVSDEDESDLFPAASYTLEGEDGDAWYVFIVTFAVTTIDQGGD